LSGAARKSPDLELALPLLNQGHHLFGVPLQPGVDHEHAVATHRQDDVRPCPAQHVDVLAHRNDFERGASLPRLILGRGIRLREHRRGQRRHGQHPNASHSRSASRSCVMRGAFHFAIQAGVPACRHFFAAFRSR
jgi:hypothetical protein